MKNTIIEDLASNLDEVQRAWIRKPATVILIPFLFIACVVVSVVLALQTFVKGIKEAYITSKEFFVECWVGKEK